MTIGEKVKRLRKEKGMTQEELGEKIGVKKAAINKYETGVVVNLKKGTIVSLAQALDVNPVWLMDEADDWPPVPSTKTLIARAFEEDKKVKEMSALNGNAEGIPRTYEARIISGGIDKMSPERRKRALILLQAAFEEFSDSDFNEEET